MGRAISWEEAARIRESFRVEKKTVVFTNGLFDLLHVGHLRYLRQARAMGDVLIVGLNSDASARAFKGLGHPIVPLDERIELLAALEPVDYVVTFDEPTAERLVGLLRPDVFVKGGDYVARATSRPDEKVPAEASVVLGYGGEVRILPYWEGHSTNDIVRRILKTHGK